MGAGGGGLADCRWGLKPWAESTWVPESTRGERLRRECRKSWSQSPGTKSVDRMWLEGPPDGVGLVIRRGLSRYLLKNLGGI